jgi:heat shock protein HslJ
MGFDVNKGRAWGTRGAYLLAIVIFAGLIASCSGNDGDNDSVSETADQTELAGTSWSLSLLNGDGLLLLSIITAEFEEGGSVSGIAGCNGYSASYEEDGDQIAISAQVTTSSSCRERLMNQESAYLETLETIVSYQVKGTTLEMRDEQGRAMLVYDSLKQTTLPGSSWTLAEYAGSQGDVIPVLPETTITADFGDDGLLTGSAGCNGYSATYDVASKLVMIETIVMTEIYCMEPEGLMDQETQYLSSLEQSAVYVIVGEAMGLLDEDGAVLAIYSSGRQ